MTTTTIREVLRAGKFTAAPSMPPAKPIVQACSPTCICGGIGLVRYDVPPDDELFGRLYPCPNLPSAARHVITPSGLYLDELDKLSWNAVRPEPLMLLFKGAKKQTNAVKVAGMMRSYLAENSGMIYISGAWGLGKTHLIKTAIAEQVNSGKRGRYIRLADVLDDIRAGFDHNDPREDARARLERYRTHPFLAIDELDKIQDTPWIEQTLFRLIDQRYELAYMGLATTLLASNNPPEAMGDAIKSRIRDGRCLAIEIDGVDVRPRMTR